MTGWNLPPGCSVRDLPGNSPDEERLEALYDKLYESLRPLGLDMEDLEVESKVSYVVEALAKIVGDAYGEGYAEGTFDSDMAHAQKIEQLEAGILGYPNPKDE